MRPLATRALQWMILVWGLLVMAPLQAQDITVMRIGTGDTGGTYFPFGGLIANAISNPPGSRACDRGGNCGVPGLIAVAQATAGSGENVAAVAEGTLDLALSQADVAFWAHHGTGAFQGRGPRPELNAIANLFPENVHLIARKDAAISHLEDLAGKRVSLGAEGSGTVIDAKLILNAFAVRLSTLRINNMAPDAAIQALIANELDAFFWVTGAPAVAVEDLLLDADVDLVPIDGPIADKLAQVFPFFTRGMIPAGVYGENPDVPTLNVAAILVTSASMDEQMAFDITKALWHPTNAALFAGGHPRGKLMDEAQATKGLGFPLHPGAARYYAGDDPTTPEG